MNQEDRILQHLGFAGSITPMAALREYGCYRLSSVIHRLRKRGINIETEIIGRRKKHFAKYILK